MGIQQDTDFKAASDSQILMAIISGTLATCLGGVITAVFTNLLKSE